MSSGLSANLFPAISAATAVAAAWKLTRNSVDILPHKESIESRLKHIHDTLHEAQELATNKAEEKSDTDSWLESLQNVMPAIVTIRIMKVRAFDDEKACCTVATGFIVDKIHGLILTNRHVISSGPVVADAIFVNHEEIELIPIYRDPVHDFGFFRFDPTHLQYIQVKEIALRPDLAIVGTDIRVVGNDNAEKVQILPGVLAKLDRAAPYYGPSGYNDFNTFYYAAASSTSGGSSGSPVLNKDGHAIALNAGAASNAASSYFLPLDRVQRALEYIQREEMVPRGTIQCVFRHSAFDETRKLGLPNKHEREIRSKFSNATGILVVDQVVPQGPAYNQLEAGDVLLKVNHEYLATFAALESILDSNIGNPICFGIQRGDTELTMELTVQDLHAITPSQFFEVGNCILHDLTYQQARNMSLPLGGVYASQIGHMLLNANIFHSCIVHQLHGQPTRTLDEFISVFKTLPQGTRTDLIYSFPTSRQVRNPAVMTVDWNWFPAQLWNRNDRDGLWHAESIMAPCTPLPPVVDTPEITGIKTEHQWSTQLLASLVYVRSEAPLEVDGINSTSYEAIGYVIDSTRGYVLVDKCNVQLFMAQINVIIAASIQIPATVCFVHPVHNFSIIQYDTRKLGANSVVKSMPIHSTSLQVGENLSFVGLTSLWTVLTASTIVTKVDRLVVDDLDVPRYKTGAVEVVHVEPMNSSALGGVLVNEKLQVVALYLEYGTEDSTDGQFTQSVHRGVPISLVYDLVSSIQNGGTPPESIRLLPVEFTTKKLSTAQAGLGLSPYWIEKLAKRYTDTRQVLCVYRCAASTQAKEQLQSGDLVLTVNDTIVVKDFDIEEICAKEESVAVRVLRHGKEIQLQVDTTVVSTLGTTRAIIWCGLIIQSPHWTIYQRGYAPCGVYCSLWFEGSPADKYAMEPRRFIVQVNEMEISDLDSFLNAVGSVGDHESVRLQVVTMASSKPEMRTLKTNYHYWPTKQVTWDRKTHSWHSVVHGN